MIFVTGGCGFIGSNFIIRWMESGLGAVCNLDKLTYAGNAQNLSRFENNKDYTFVKTDINETERISNLFKDLKPKAVIHFAAESHVDRSISGPKAFIETNIVGTFSLLEAAKNYWSKLNEADKNNFRFIHVSTDEVYGSLTEQEDAFSENSNYQPNSPYSASKASSDHLVRSYFHTYGLPTIITNCSNNYGPLQFPEKLIPLIIERALEEKELPIYGDGKNIRDWLHVEDHCDALIAILNKAKPGSKYNIGGINEVQNIEVVKNICELLDTLQPRANKKSYFELKTFVNDRPGHDRRYAIDPKNLQNDIGWKPKYTFTEGLKMTVNWYLQNRHWVHSVKTGEYKNWIQRNYGDRS